MKAVSTDRAVRRYLQIAQLETTVKLVEEGIRAKQIEIDDATEQLEELRKQKRELLAEIRAAAADEGQLPLFDNLSELLTDVERLCPPRAAAPSPSLDDVADRFIASTPPGTSVTLSVHTDDGAPVGQPVHITPEDSERARQRIANRSAY